MIFFPNCKINLGLRILRKRADGYHDLETLFYPLPVYDILEIVPSEELRFTATGIAIPGDPEANLCLRAFHLLKKDFPTLSPVQIYLHKHIPIGAGLGGGSSDGAHMLLLLNAHFRLQLNTDQLIAYASQLGSDCPFFILNTPSLGGGRGEKLKEIELDLSKYAFVIVHPGIHISTSAAFEQCQPREGGKCPGTIIQQPIPTWPGELVNDFEAPLFAQYPVLKSIKEELYNKGALYASLTGSGSSLFGIFEKGKLPELQLDPAIQILHLP
jgi:4-diphosphocytidyl-2-C-methyl-D-erythritol kinase